MYNRRIFILTAAGISAGLALIQVWGVPLKDFFAAALLYTLVGLMIVIYLLRFGFIILAVLAIYHLLCERYARRSSA